MEKLWCYRKKPMIRMKQNYGTIKKTIVLWKKTVILREKTDDTIVNYS